MIPDAPTKRKMRSLRPMPHRPACRSNDQMYIAPGTSATTRTAAAWNEVGIFAVSQPESQAAVTRLGEAATPPM